MSYQNMIVNKGRYLPFEVSVFLFVFIKMKGII